MRSETDVERKKLLECALIHFKGQDCGDKSSSFTPNWLSNAGSSPTDSNTESVQTLWVALRI